MLLREFAIVAERQVWAKSGQKVVRKYRCTSGQRKGRVVKMASQCFAAPNIAARIRLKKTKAQMNNIQLQKEKLIYIMLLHLIELVSN